MTVSSATNRVSYNGNGSTTVFAYTFKIFDEDDLTVILRASDGTETVRTITTHYTVSGVGNSGGGNVTMLTAPATGQTLVILRELDLVQELDIVENDPFPATSVEDALDKLTMMVHQHEEELGRTIKASKTNTITNPEFTLSAAARAGKLFAFDSTGNNLTVTGELGTYRGNWASGSAYLERDIVKDTSTNNIFICLVSHTSSGSQPLTTNTDSAKWALLVDAASATTSASNAASSASAAATSASNASTSASNAATSASNASSSASSAASSASSAAASFDSFDDRYLGAKSSNPTLDNDGNALLTGALYFNTTSTEMRAYTGSTWVSAYLPATTYVTITGTETLTNKTLTDPAIIGTIIEDIFTITDGAAFEIDPANGSIQLITLGASRTPKATNFLNGEGVTMMIDDGSAFTITWTDSTFGGSGVVWKTNAGVAPTLITTGFTVINLWKVGGQVYGARVGNA